MIIVQLDSEQLSNLIQTSVRKVLKETPPQTVEPTDQPEQLLTIQEAAEFLSLTVRTMYSKVLKGELRVIKRSKRLYFSRTELTDYLKGGRNKTHAETAQEAEAFLADSNQRKNILNKAKKNSRREGVRGKGKITTIGEGAFTILQKYYCENLVHLNGIYKLCKIVMGIGFLLIVGTIVKSLFLELKMNHETIGILAGIVTEIIGPPLYIYKLTTKQALYYSKSLEDISKVGVSIKILESIKTDDSLESKINETKLEIAKMLLAGNKNNA